MVIRDFADQQTVVSAMHFCGMLTVKVSGKPCGTHLPSSLHIFLLPGSSVPGKLPLGLFHLACKSHLYTSEIHEISEHSGVAGALKAGRNE